MKSFIVRCVKCGRWRAIRTNKILTCNVKCFGCNKSFKLKKLNELGLNPTAYEVLDYASAFEKVQKLNERENK